MSAPHCKSNYVLYNPPWHGKTEWYLERQVAVASPASGVWRGRGAPKNILLWFSRGLTGPGSVLVVPRNGAIPSLGLSPHTRGIGFMP